MRHSTGLTLVELLAVLAMVAVLSTIATPNLARFIRSSERAAAVNEFLHAIYFARTEAIKRGTVVNLCKTADGEHCANDAASWSSGWMVFVNSDHDDLPVRDPGEPVLRRYAGWPRGRITSNRQAFSFRAYTQSTVNGTIVFCPAGYSRDARAIIISHTGRPRLSSKDAEGKALRCD
jgi:type IV fimbrial biogenesis protein FimT